MKVNPYLNFDGKTEEAFLFYKSIFGGEFIAHMKMSDAPDMNHLPKEEMNRVMHISLPLGKDTILMGSDILPSVGHELNVGNNVYVSIHPTNREEADRFFAGLSKGGEIEMPMADQFWGDYFGSLVDRFGIRWMINHNDDF